MKKIIVLFALIACLLPFGVYGAGICEVKCCDPATGCEDLDSFCNNLAPNNQTGISELSSCSIDQITAAKCGTSDTAVCCCFKDRNITTTKVSNKVTSLNFTPEISIPGSAFSNTAPTKIGTPIETVKNGVTTVTMNSDLLARYIQAVYNYGLAIVSILAAIVLMGGGLIWLTSGGDSSKVTKAKEMIIGSISGLAILFCAWIILNTVNPELLKLKPISTVVINKINMTCCQQGTKAEISTDKDCKDKGGQSFVGYFVNTSKTKCELPGCCITKNTQTDKIVECYNSTQSNCTMTTDKVIAGDTIRLTIATTFLTSNCETAKNTNKDLSQAPNCPDSCSSANDGTPCSDIGNGFCYSGICWKWEGEEGEPCGNDGGICTKNPFNLNPLVVCDKGKFDAGGRSCVSGFLIPGSGLTCCIPPKN